MTKKNESKAKIYKYRQENGFNLVAINDLAKRSHPTMGGALQHLEDILRPINKLLLHFS